jgi:hypothetical protein
MANFAQETEKFCGRDASALAIDNADCGSGTLLPWTVMVRSNVALV